ncbi:solute carrier family 2, facilitated glucose transporter member 5-like [Sceloporus undulatus]|uniref:solute carrier family 2, facilitated glucose transporter member 5-like n=1 Tax=Sceloporus undulatus TaxID=8520 RepID=UPI001C4D1239|nr:solute carrier family 2, facilitated glucose transporter member 5-like [Sceloporus undulatus]
MEPGQFKMVSDWIIATILDQGHFTRSWKSGIYQENKASWMPYVNSVLLNIFLVVHAVGPTTLPNLMIGELFLQSSRSSAYVIGGFVHWIIHFFTIFSYLQIQPYVGAYSFLACFPICIATFLYIYKKVPETKGKTFLDIWKLVPGYEDQKAVPVFEVQPDQEKLEQEQEQELEQEQEQEENGEPKEV